MAETVADLFSGIITGAVLSNLLLALGLGAGVLESGRIRLEHGEEEALAGFFAMLLGLSFCYVVDHALRSTGLEGPWRVPVFTMICYIACRSMRYGGYRPAKETVLTATLAGAFYLSHKQAGLYEALGFTLGSALGISVIWMLLVGIMERLELSRVPKNFKGAPIFFVSLGVLSLIFGVIQKAVMRNM